MSKSIFAKQAKLTKALAHPSRLEIIHVLRAHSLTVGQITQMLGARQAYVSQHLLILKHARVVRASRAGKEIYYELTDPRLLKASDLLHSLVANKPMPVSGEPKVVDPICQMLLTPSSASYTEEYNGIRHYFCGRGCLKKFNGIHKGAQ
jgi:DNA-binding transcriptional ArsR family regulator/YHS domain-containing protein